MVFACRYNLLETVRNNVKLLNEMLDCYQMSGTSSMSDKDIIKELYKNIDVERPKLFKLASETEDKDSEGMSKRFCFTHTSCINSDLKILLILNAVLKSKTQPRSRSSL